jgi:hypothetical protein
MRPSTDPMPPCCARPQSQVQELTGGGQRLLAAGRQLQLRLADLREVAAKAAAMKQALHEALPSTGQAQLAGAATARGKQT